MALVLPVGHAGGSAAQWSRTCLSIVWHERRRQPMAAYPGGCCKALSWLYHLLHILMHRAIVGALSSVCPKSPVGFQAPQAIGRRPDPRRRGCNGASVFSCGDPAAKHTATRERREMQLPAKQMRPTPRSLTRCRTRRWPRPPHHRKSCQREEGAQEDGVVARALDVSGPKDFPRGMYFAGNSPPKIIPRLNPDLGARAQANERKARAVGCVDQPSGVSSRPPPPAQIFACFELPAPPCP